MAAFSRKSFSPLRESPLLQNREYLVSIIVPVRDRADFLVRCLDSLKSQDFSEDSCEIIVCDDGSTEALSGAIEKYQPGLPCIRLVRQDPLGPATARNLGVRESASPIVLFVDSDIVADKELVGSLVNALIENPDWAGAEACLISAEEPQSPLWEAPGAASGGRFHTAAIAYRREALMAAGGLDETFSRPVCEDVELAARVLRLGTIGFVAGAKAYHPRRRVTLRTHWRSRLNWKYLVILAERYGFLAFPERKICRFPRLRVALAAVVTLPIGRLLSALRWLKRSPSDSAVAVFYALFDIVCGLLALPSIFFCSIPERLDYLGNEAAPRICAEMQPETRV
jgi:GT2 family glycosyltransferase